MSPLFATRGEDAGFGAFFGLIAFGLALWFWI
jgi:hypothetical protein